MAGDEEADPGTVPSVNEHLRTHG